MSRRVRLITALAAIMALGIFVADQASAAPDGTLTWGVHISLAPTWLDPAEMPALITPYMMLYALHEGMAKPMPDNRMTPSLATSWVASKDGLSYEFVLRKGVRFHHGDLVTAEDVKFSFERYRGANAKGLKDRVAAVEIPEPGRVRFRLKAPWPDFLLFYTTASGASWIVPKAYVEKVGVDQWDPKSPWHDRRVRLAANHAIDRTAINQAITLGHSRVIWSIIPSTFDFFWPAPAYKYDPALAKKLLAEAGFPNGFDAGDYYTDVSYANVQEANVDFLQKVGIKARLRPLERVAFTKAYTEKTFKNLSYTATGAFGNAATRLESFVVTGGAYVYGSYPDLDGLFKEQLNELDRKRREAMLHTMQQLIHEKAMVIPIWELAFINAHGPRVGESGLGLIPGHAYSAPYEDEKLKAGAK